MRFAALLAIVGQEGLRNSVSRKAMNVRRSLTLLVYALIAVSCGGGSGSPAPPTSPAPRVVSITVTGPSTNPTPGQSANFSALAVYNNGNTASVTTAATWLSSNTQVATVGASGVVLAVNPGVSDIRATFEGVTGTRQVTVDAPPTPPPPPAPVGLTLTGTVRDQGNNNPVVGAEVRIKDTSNVTTTNAAGGYSFSGLSAGSLMLRATKSGYELTEVAVTVSGNTTSNFTMRASSGTPAPSPDPVNGICNAAAYPSSTSCGVPTAVCNDNSLSCAQNRQGTCSSRQGVKCWLCPGRLCNGITTFSEPLNYTPVPTAMIRRR